MFTITLSLFLGAYGLVLLFALFMSLASTYHLVRYGATTKISFVITFAFFAGSIIILSLTSFALRGTDWSQEITLGAPGSAQQIESL